MMFATRVRAVPCLNQYADMSSRSSKAVDPESRCVRECRVVTVGVSCNGRGRVVTVYGGAASRCFQQLATVVWAQVVSNSGTTRAA